MDLTFTGISVYVGFITASAYCCAQGGFSYFSLKERGRGKSELRVFVS